MIITQQQVQYAKYRRSQIAELADWTPGFDMSGVSVSDSDKRAGSPKLGDKIARNPVNHADRWLVAADYFLVNFEPIEQGAQPGADALRELAAAKRNLDFESNARNHGSAPEAMLAALAAKKRFDAALNAVLAAPQPQQEREQEQSK